MTTEYMPPDVAGQSDTDIRQTHLNILVNSGLALTGFVSSCAALAAFIV